MISEPSSPIPVLIRLAACRLGVPSRIEPRVAPRIAAAGWALALLGRFARSGADVEPSCLDFLHMAAPAEETPGTASPRPPSHLAALTIRLHLQLSLFGRMPRSPERPVLDVRSLAARLGPERPGGANAFPSRQAAGLRSVERYFVGHGGPESLAGPPEMGMGPRPETSPHASSFDAGASPPTAYHSIAVSAAGPSLIRVTGAERISAWHVAPLGVRWLSTALDGTGHHRGRWQATALPNLGHIRVEASTNLTYLPGLHRLDGPGRPVAASGDDFRVSTEWPARRDVRLVAGRELAGGPHVLAGRAEAPRSFTPLSLVRSVLTAPGRETGPTFGPPPARGAAGRGGSGAFTPASDRAFLRASSGAGPSPSIELAIRAGRGEPGSATRVTHPVMVLRNSPVPPDSFSIVGAESMAERLIVARSRVEATPEAMGWGAPGQTAPVARDFARPASPVIAVADAGFPRGQASTFDRFESAQAGRRADDTGRPPAWAAPSPADLSAIADQVVRTLDDRIVAHRERFGRI